MNPLKHPAAHQIPENDIEKRGHEKDSSVNVTPSENSQDSSQLAATDIAPTPVLLRGRLARWNAKVESLAGLGTFFESMVPLLSRILGLEEFPGILARHAISSIIIQELGDTDRGTMI